VGISDRRHHPSMRPLVKRERTNTYHTLFGRSRFICHELHITTGALNLGFHVARNLRNEILWMLPRVACVRGKAVTALQETPR
jgi:hypothetical protein